MEWLFIASSAMNDFVHKMGSQSLASRRPWPWPSPSPRLGVGWTEVWALPVPLGSCVSWAKFFSETEKPQFLKSISGANTYTTGWWQRPSEIRLSVKKKKKNRETVRPCGSPSLKIGVTPFEGMDSSCSQAFENHKHVANPCHTHTHVQWHKAYMYSFEDSWPPRTHPWLPRRTFGLALLPFQVVLVVRTC